MEKITIVGMSKRLCDNICKDKNCLKEKNPRKYVRCQLEHNEMVRFDETTQETAENLINTLRNRITKTIEQECICGASVTKRISYDLQIKILPHTTINGDFSYRYLIFYHTTDFVKDYNKYIGEHAGMGFETIKEAVEDLKRYIK
jgi:hypothetical protein